MGNSFHYPGLFWDGTAASLPNSTWYLALSRRNISGLCWFAIFLIHPTFSTPLQLPRCSPGALWVPPRQIQIRSHFKEQEFSPFSWVLLDLPNQKLQLMQDCNNIPHLLFVCDFLCHNYSVKQPLAKWFSKWLYLFQQDSSLAFWDHSGGSFSKRCLRQIQIPGVIMRTIEIVNNYSQSFWFNPPLPSDSRFFHLSALHVSWNGMKSVNAISCSEWWES